MMTNYTKLLNLSKKLTFTLITILSITAYANAKGTVPVPHNQQVLPDTMIVVCVPANERTVKWKGIKVIQFKKGVSRVCWIDHAANMKKYIHDKEGNKIQYPLTEHQIQQLTKEI